MTSRESRSSGLRAAAWLLLLTWVACGGGSGSGPSPSGYTFATSVDGGLALNGLSTDQATQLCADVNAANASHLQATYCSAVNQAFAVDAARTALEGNPGTSTAKLQATCTSYLMGESSDSCFPATTCDASTIAMSAAGCTATVSDVVACINDNAAIAQDLLSTSPSCSNVSASSLNQFFADGGAFDMYRVPSMSASCEALIPCRGISTLTSPGAS